MTSAQSGRIPESFIHEVLAKTDIIAVVQESVKLKKTGANYSACCPFHHEKTPSFTVSQTKQFYHCFGCGKHGDAIRFLMENQSFSFVEAVERLANRVGLIVPKDPKDQERLQVKRHTTSILNQVADFYRAMLKTHPEGKRAVEYLKKRGLTGLIAKTYALGFAPSGWDNLLSHFQGNAEALKVLTETGLIIKHPQGRFYDRFRDRIMFPIRDRKGEVIGFGGRVMGEGQPKYLNSPESPIFQKGHCLYGVYEMFHAKEKWQKAIVVEGYFDVVSLAQYGFVSAVATLGTAITPYHLTNLFQWGQEVVFCFDGDNAGKAAAWKALQLVLPVLSEGRQVRFAFLPQGEDPDTYIRKVGVDCFRELIEQGTSLSEYFFATLLEKGIPHSVDSRAQVASIARPMLEQIPAGIFKEMMFEQLAQVVQSSSYVVRGEKAPRFTYQNKDPNHKNYKKYSKYPNAQHFPKEKAPPQPFSPALLASAILLREPSLYEQIARVDLYSHETHMEGLPSLQALCSLLQAQPDLPAQALRLALQQKNLLSQQLIECEKKVQLVPFEGLSAELIGALNRFEVIGQQQLAERLLKKAKQSDLTTEEKQKLKEILKFSGIN